MKKIIIALVLLNNLIATAQEKIITKTGEVNFEASVPSFEEVKGKNNSVSCVLNTKTGHIASMALAKGFRFKVALMEEHFNENYIESDKFPKITFKGIIENFKFEDLTSNEKLYKIIGTMELHGKTKEIVINTKIKKVNNITYINSSFSINVSDFDIEIPSVVSKKLSKKVNIISNFELK
ncbi:MAG: YceI family protein [Flavobacterium sp.]